MNDSSPRLPETLCGGEAWPHSQASMFTQLAGHQEAASPVTRPPYLLPLDRSHRSKPTGVK